MTWLKAMFGAVLAGMIVVTVRGFLDRPVWEAGNIVRDPWGFATLADAYCGFLTFYVWVAYRERGPAARVLWFVLIMALGNIAMSVYVLLVLLRLPQGASVEDLLLRPRRAAG
jgi:hypothetical protein